LGHFLGIFEIFRGGKVTLDHKIGKFYLLNILYTHQKKNFGLVKFFQKCIDCEIASFAKNSKSGKMGEKGQSCKFHIVAVFDWSIRLNF
jgi:hypothetical protein